MPWQTTALCLHMARTPIPPPAKTLEERIERAARIPREAIPPALFELVELLAKWESRKTENRIAVNVAETENSRNMPQLKHE